MAARPLICFERVVEERLFFRDYSAYYDESDFMVSVFHDGIMTKSDQGLVIRSVPFTHVSSMAAEKPSIDYYKFPNFYNQGFTVTGAETVFEATMGAEQHFDSNQPIPPCFIPRVDNIMSDYRLCTSAMLVRDKNGFGLTVGFLLTNDRIYAYYACERRPSVEVDGHFTYVVPVVTRGLSRDGSVLTSTYRLGIGLSNLKQRITWYVDGDSVLCVTRPGHRLDGRYHVLECGGYDTLLPVPKHVEFGFAHMTFLDHQLTPHRIVRDDQTYSEYTLRRSATGLVCLGKASDYNEIYPDYRGIYDSIEPAISFASTKPEGHLRIFGQGVTTLVCQVSVVVRQRDLVPYEGESSVDESQSYDTGYYPFPVPRFS